MTDIKYFKPVAATFAGTAGSTGSFPTPGAPGSSVSLTLTPIGTNYSTLINNTGTLEVELVTDDSAATATPTGLFVAAIHRTALPTYTDGDGGMLHLDNRGRLLVSAGEGTITADVEIDQDPAPATPAGSFISMKYEASLPTYTAGDAATLHADSRGRLLVASIDLGTGATASVSTEDSAGPANPVGGFTLGLYRASLPTYADGDAANFHFASNGRLLTSTSPSLPSTSTTASVAGSASSTSILASNANRLGATIFNEQPTDGSGVILYLLLDAAAASTTNYTVQMSPNTYYEVPFGYTGEIRGIWPSATGDARVTELT